MCNSVNLEAGMVVWAVVPYAQGGGEKSRPAIVLDAEDDLVHVVWMTSQSIDECPRKNEVIVRDGKELTAMGLVGSHHKPGRMKFSKDGMMWISAEKVLSVLSDTTPNSVLARMALAYRG
jgi:hypothetical protein